ncbi:hypothetical protein LPJ61_001035 [Coemansia biformis]|uniref:RING-type domain-containing protein n=1 Tax=Coemansia biformis TaxID=1286918 RepID=A0A9W7YGS7_9FUNG|nr:hypothetical protein LPJ61_001035 [Coemansia biformis]
MAPLAAPGWGLEQPPQWAKRQDTSDTVGSGTKNMLKIVYIILLILWALIVVVVLLLAHRRYQRTRARRQQEQQADDTNGIALGRVSKRKLTEDEIATLKVATLTDDDIQRSLQLATRRISAPNSIHPRTSTDSVHPPPASALPLTLQSVRRIGTVIALAAPEPVVPGGCRSPVEPPSRQPRRTRSLPLQPRPQLEETGAACTLQKKDYDTARKRRTISPLHEENCAVCLDDFVVGAEVRQLPCQHYFHLACIDPWLLNNSAICPLCNFDVGAAFDEAKEDPAEES